MEELLARLGGRKKGAKKLECHERPDTPGSIKLVMYIKYPGAGHYEHSTETRVRWDCKQNAFTESHMLSAMKTSVIVTLKFGEWDNFVQSPEITMSNSILEYNYRPIYKFFLVDTYYQVYAKFNKDNNFNVPQLNLKVRIVPPTPQTIEDTRKELEEVRTVLRNTQEQLRLCQQSKAPSKDINKPFTGPPSTAALVEE